MADDNCRRLIGSWELGPTLGEGGFSKVKLGTHKDTGKKAALKILQKHALAGSSSEKQVKREIEAMSKVKHRNVIELIEVEWNAKYPKKNGVHEDVILVVLELATGGELFEFLSYTGCFQESTARAYFQQLVAGVSACHTAGIAHRDLKPENLLLGQDFVLKLADFGFSHHFSQSDRVMYTECGTPGYMAPEVFESHGYDATKSDLWACGVILFIMLAGFPPFQRPSSTDWWFDKLKKGKQQLFWRAHQRSATFSEDAKGFLNGLLNVDPSKRMTVDDIRAHSWFQGDTVDEAAICEQFAIRKDQLDTQKKREKEDSKAHDDNVGFLEQGVVHRGLSTEMEVDDFPAGPPSFAFGTGGGGGEAAVPTTTDTALSASSSPPSRLATLGAFSDATKSFMEIREEKRAEAAYEPALSCYTRFYSTSSSAQIVERLNQALAHLDGQRASSEKQYKVKAKVLTPFGTVILQANVFQDAAQRLQVCEVRRRKGEAMVFNQVFDHLREQLADIITTPVKPGRFQI